MIIEDLISKVQEMSPTKNYWFVRTDGGENFDSFYENSFIGIGWNEITARDITEKESSVVKEKIARVYKLDTSISKSKSKVTSIYNKLKKFKELNRGDLVIIPSNSSSRYAFGIIDDGNIYTETENLKDCSYYKRRKINWITIKNTGSLNPIFFQLKISRHSIGKINSYSSYIDNVTNNLYLKQGFGHFVIDITTKEDININSLISLINSMQELSEKINTHFQLNEEIKKSSIKLNLQSPGKIEFKFPVGKTLVTLATILSIVGCRNDVNNGNVNDPDLDAFMQVNERTLDTINKNMNELEADWEKIKKIN